jgi:hypothetical protein
MGTRTNRNGVSALFWNRFCFPGTYNVLDKSTIITRGFMEIHQEKTIILTFKDLKKEYAILGIPDLLDFNVDINIFCSADRIIYEDRYKKLYTLKDKYFWESR